MELSGSVSCSSLIDAAVCDSENRDCMMGECDEWRVPWWRWGVLLMLNHLVDGSDDGDLGEEIRYKLWVTNSHCKAHATSLRGQGAVSLLQTAEGKRGRRRSGSPGFSTNFSFVVQDAAQGFHWDTKQSIVHPFLVYRRENGEQRHQSFWVISDTTKHTTSTVASFLRRLVPAVKEEVPDAYFPTVYYSLSFPTRQRISARRLARWRYSCGSKPRPSAVWRWVTDFSTGIGLNCIYLTRGRHC